jgi:hypothetical protein
MKATGHRMELGLGWQFRMDPCPIAISLKYSIFPLLWCQYSFSCPQGKHLCGRNFPRAQEVTALFWLARILKKHVFCLADPGVTWLRWGLPYLHISRGDPSRTVTMPRLHCRTHIRLDPLGSSTLLFFHFSEKYFLGYVMGHIFPCGQCCTRLYVTR